MFIARDSSPLSHPESVSSFPFLVEEVEGSDGYRGGVGGGGGIGAFVENSPRRLKILNDYELGFSRRSPPFILIFFIDCIKKDTHYGYFIQISRQ